MSFELCRLQCNEQKCFSCKKPDHFPQSMNCKKTRKDKFKLKSFLVSSCMRLREFLKSVKIKECLVPKAEEKERWQKSKQKITPFKITAKLLELINDRIQFLETVENGILQPDKPVENNLNFSPLRIKGGGTDMPFRMSAFKSNFPAVDTIAYIFRSLQEDWSHFKSHPLCSHSAKTETGFRFFCVLYSKCFNPDL